MLGTRSQSHRSHGPLDGLAAAPMAQTTRSQSHRSHGPLDGLAAAPMAQTTAGTPALAMPNAGADNS